MDTPKAHVIDHPLVQQMVTLAREQAATPMTFRRLVRQLGMMLTYEATRDLRTTPREVQTPLEPATGVRLARPIAVVPILRAGLGLSESVLELIPDAVVCHLGMFRDEQKLTPVSYYENLPAKMSDATVLVVDPMLATGGSATAAIGRLKEMGCHHIRFLCVIAAPEGVTAVNAQFPDVPIYTAALDDHLDESGYIRPGLGDAGDRIFGT